MVFKPERKKNKTKQKNHSSKGRLKTSKHIQISSAFLQLSGNNQVKQPVPWAHSWKTEPITQGLFTVHRFLLPHPPSRNLDSGSVMMSF